MEKKKLIITSLLALIIGVGSISGCMTTGTGEHGITMVENMSELQYQQWKRYIELGVKIAANRLLAEEVVTAEELELAAKAMDALAAQDAIVIGGESIVSDALQDVGLTNDEVELLLLVVEQEIRNRIIGDAEIGSIVPLTKRTKEMLGVVASALRSASVVTNNELNEFNSMTM